MRFRSDASRDRSLDRPVVDVVDDPSVRSTRQRDVHWWTEDVETVDGSISTLSLFFLLTFAIPKPRRK